MLALAGGAAMFLGSNLDFFSAAPATADVEGRFLLSREAIVQGKFQEVNNVEDGEQVNENLDQAQGLRMMR
jgi:hypothetical protein